VATLGSTAAVSRYRVRLGSKKVAQLEPRPSPFTLTLHRRGRFVRVDALDAAGKSLAADGGRVTGLRAGKRDVSSGSGVGT